MEIVMVLLFLATLFSVSMSLASRIFGESRASWIWLGVAWFLFIVVLIADGRLF